MIEIISFIQTVIIVVIFVRLNRMETDLDDTYREVDILKEYQTEMMIDIRKLKTIHKDYMQMVKINCIIDSEAQLDKELDELINQKQKFTHGIYDYKDKKYNTLHINAVDGFVQAKDPRTRVWVDSVAYQSIEDNTIYVREVEDFKAKFVYVEEWSD